MRVVNYEVLMREVEAFNSRDEDKKLDKRLKNLKDEYEIKRPKAEAKRD